MANYQSIHSGQHIDDVISNALLQSTAATIYLAKATDSPLLTNKFLRSDNTWSNTLTGRLYLNGVAQTANDHIGQLNIVSNCTLDDGSYFSTIGCFAPDVGDSQHLIMIGTARSTYNSCYYGFHYDSDGSSNNYMTMGLYANDKILNIKANGTVLIGDTVSPNTSVWTKGDTIIGKSGTDKVIIGYLTSSTNGAVIGGHNSALTSWAPLNIAGTALYFRLNETIRMKMLDGCLSLFPANSSYREGIRIHSCSSWSDITLCGNDNTGDSGISANSWFIGNNNGNFYITRNGSTSGTYIFYCTDRWRTNREVACDNNSVGGQFRAVAGNYGCMLRNDGSSTFFLLTASGSQYGTWNSLRPFYINNSTGACTVATSSDRRFKNILGEMSSNEAQNLLSNVRIVNYTYLMEGDNSIERNGIIAQELKEELIKLGINSRPYISLNFSGEENNNEQVMQTSELMNITEEQEEKGRYSIDYGQLTPILWKGWQIHEQIIQELKEKIQILEEKIKGL